MRAATVAAKVAGSAAMAKGEAEWQARDGTGTEAALMEEAGMGMVAKEALGMKAAAQVAWVVDPVVVVVMRVAMTGDTRALANSVAAAILAAARVTANAVLVALRAGAPQVDATAGVAVVVGIVAAG